MAQVTIREVARAAGVSIASVSDILSDTPRCSYRADTVARVRDAASRTGYRPHAMARSLRSGTTNFVGVALGAGVAPLISSLVVNIRHALARHGFQPMLVDFSRLDPARDDASALPMHMLAGLISADLSLEQDGSALPGVAGECPIVAVYPTSRIDVDCVTTDRTRAVEMAAGHLVELGHSRIAFGQMANPTHPVNEPKVRGWKNVRERHGIDPDGRYTVSLPIGLSGTEAYARYFADALCRMDPPPSAFISMSDDVALATIGILSSRGWRIPENLSVVGFDGVFYGRFVWPALTTISQPLELIAESAAARLETLIRERRSGETAAPAHQFVEPELVVRSSTLPFASWKPFRADR